MIMKIVLGTEAVMKLAAIQSKASRIDVLVSVNGRSKAS